MEDITDGDYALAKRNCKDLEVNLGEYHDFYVQSQILLLADVSENFRNMCLKIHILSCKISFSSWISKASSFKKD